MFLQRKHCTVQDSIAVNVIVENASRYPRNIYNLHNIIIIIIFGHCAPAGPLPAVLTVINISPWRSTVVIITNTNKECGDEAKPESGILICKSHLAVLYTVFPL